MAAAPGEYNGQFVEPWVVHDLRRSHFTGLLELGLSADVVDALQNHISGASRHGVRKNYNHATYAAAKRSAVGIWNAHVSKLLNIQ